MVWRQEFTDREMEITNLVSLGLRNDEISKKLNISEPTVKTHLRNIYSKSDIHDRANLAIRVLNSDKD
jgi:DNA-binding NarL/FixJ family response regulator